MSHDIHFNQEGKASMAYVGREPWWGGGQQLTPGADISVWEEEGGFNWEIQSSALTYKVPPPADSRRVVDVPKTFPARRALYRSDDYSPLSIVSSGYKIVQPKEVLHFFKSLVETGGFELETCGILFNGQKFWALAKVGTETKIAGVDEVQGYLLLSSSCDYSMATTAGFVVERVVCHNTLGIALSEIETGKSIRSIKIPHNRVFNADEVKAQLGLIPGSFQAFTDKANALAERRVSEREASEWLIRLFARQSADQAIITELLAGQTGQKDQEREVVAELLGQSWSQADRTDAVEALLENVDARAMKAVHELYAGKAVGSELKSADGTAWGLVNAVTEYVDHYRGARSVDHRINNSLFGENSNIKYKAWDLADLLLK